MGRYKDNAVSRTSGFYACRICDVVEFEIYQILCLVATRKQSYYGYAGRLL